MAAACSGPEERIPISRTGDEPGGARAAWFRPRLVAPRGVARHIARLASIAVAPRTPGPGVPGTWTRAGLMEPRYVLVVFPFLLLALVEAARPWRARRDSRNAM